MVFLSASEKLDEPNVIKWYQPKDDTELCEHIVGMLDDNTYLTQANRAGAVNP